MKFEQITEELAATPIVSNEQSIEELDAALNSAGVTPKEREILLMRFGGGQTFEQIGQRFGIPVNRVGIMIGNLVKRVSSI